MPWLDGDTSTRAKRGAKILDRPLAVVGDNNLMGAEKICLEEKVWPVVRLGR